MSKGNSVLSSYGINTGLQKKSLSPSTHLCVYCGAKATTRDHVPPRLLLERPYPENLRTVPCCLDCNRGASADEEYFLALIAQVSLSPFIGAKLAPGGTLDRAFTRSPALEQRFLDAMGVDEDTGKPFVRPELSRATRVVKKSLLAYSRLDTVGLRH